jgi:cell cycle arrest protein BUB2
MGQAADLASTAHAFNKILSQPRLSSKTRTPDDVEEGVKKLRRLILIEGIPSKAVRTHFELGSLPLARSMC